MEKQNINILIVVASVVLSLIGIMLEHYKIPFELSSIIFFVAEIFLVKQFAKKVPGNNLLLLPILGVIILGILTYLIKQDQIYIGVSICTLIVEWTWGITMGYIYSITNKKYQYPLLIIFLISLIVLYFVSYIGVLANTNNANSWLMNTLDSVKDSIDF